jgi:exopolyphosphatase / guanosine-5'-triphosphate,3'-diphosphate pyrophosphatase
MRPMHVAVVDVGSNTIRLLVGARDGDRIAEIVRDKRVVGLGADVERSGAISAPKLAETVECVAGFVEDARGAGAELIDVVVASPGRQARNAPQLIHLLSRATEIEARVLSREDEARLAFEGALAGITPRGAVAVCDVGGGSAQVAIGTVEHGPAWLRSVDLGSLRLSARIPHGDPPGRKELAALRSEARAAVSALTPPLPGGAVAVGGTARSLRKLVGPSMGEGELDEAFDLLRRTPAAELAGRYDIDLWRARALPAGTAIVAALQSLLGVSLEVGRGGLREGVVLELLDRLSLPAVQAGGR